MWQLLGSKIIKESKTDIATTFSSFATKIKKNSQLLARLATVCDMQTIVAYYHKSCSTKLYTLACSANWKETKATSRSHCSENPSQSCDAIAIAELLEYVNEYPNRILKLKDIKKLYEDRLKQLGFTEKVTSNSTRLKEGLLKEVPGLTSLTAGRHTDYA